MMIKGKGGLLALGALGLILAGAGPAFAQHSGGGGHGGGGGGGGGSAGGGHGGGGGGHAGGGGVHGSGGHIGGGGAHFAAPAHYAGGGARYYGGGSRYAGSTGHYGGGYGGASHTAYAGRGGYGGHGYSTGGYRGGYGYGGGWRGGGWHGGYWNGGFWPRCYYGAGFAWFLPILPLAYATYWYSGVPYYYANDVYYTYNPSYEGYVVTDPPPVAESSGSAEGAALAPSDAGSADQGPGSAWQIFMYPKNGQSAEQQAVDKAECQRWASDQAGQVAQNGSDYSRAMVACVEGRGYSAR